jgi:hypothetical protein
MWDQASMACNLLPQPFLPASEKPRASMWKLFIGLDYMKNSLRFDEKPDSNCAVFPFFYQYCHCPA